MRERWEDDSRCLTTTADRLLFAAAFEKTAPVLLVDEARRVCMSCPVASRCLQEALADEQAGGVRWGHHGEGAEAGAAEGQAQEGQA